MHPPHHHCFRHGGGVLCVTEADKQRHLVGWAGGACRAVLPATRFEHPHPCFRVFSCSSATPSRAAGCLIGLGAVLAGYPTLEANIVGYVFVGINNVMTALSLTLVCFLVCWVWHTCFLAPWCLSVPIPHHCPSLFSGVCVRVCARHVDSVTAPYVCVHVVLCSRSQRCCRGRSASSLRCPAVFACPAVFVSWPLVCLLGCCVVQIRAGGQHLGTLVLQCHDSATSVSAVWCCFGRAKHTLGVPIPDEPCSSLSHRVVCFLALRARLCTRWCADSAWALWWIACGAAPQRFQFGVFCSALLGIVLSYSIALCSTINSPIATRLVCMCAGAWCLVLAHLPRLGDALAVWQCYWQPQGHCIYRDWSAVL